MPESEQHFVAVLLAAGAGSRFGGDKLRHPLDDGVAIAAHAARNLMNAGLGVVAVVREGDAPLRDLLLREGCHVTECRDAGRGMGVSLAHGIATASDADGWIVALADMPRIRPQTIRSVVGALTGGAAIAAPLHAGERGHPVGFASRLRDELLELDGDSGARDVVKRHRSDVLYLECDDPGVVYDIDQKSDITSTQGMP